MNCFIASLLFSLLALVVAPASASSLKNSLKPFETDGCTMFVDGPPDKPELWKHCCVEHDMRYWFGGDMLDRDQTDLQLRSCVQVVAGASWAELIYLGVRAGHRSPIKNKTQWSWGWSEARQNTKLTPAETEYVISELRRLPFDRTIIEKFIERNFRVSHDHL
jgi:hypothetical protein